MTIILAHTGQVLHFPKWKNKANFEEPITFSDLKKSWVILKSNNNAMNDIEEITKALVKFRDERDWGQFHDSKNLATAISIEAAELNEIFLWKTIKESEEVEKEKIKEELADIFAFSLLLAHKHGFDVKEIIIEKVEKNAEKYPIEKSKGTAKKYDEL